MKQNTTQSSTATTVPSLTDVRRLIQQQQNRDQSAASAPIKVGDTATTGSTTLHRIEFMRKIEEGRVNLDGNQQQACVFQQLDLDKDLLKNFDQMNFAVGDLDGATMGKRNANTRRIVIPLATSDRRKSDAAAKKSIRNEYASRYCELINVTPSAKNLARIQRMIPLESCTVSHMYNAGQARNNIVIEPSRVNMKIKEKDTTDDVVYKLLSVETEETDSSKASGNPKAPNTRKVTENAEFMRTQHSRNVTDIQELCKFPTFDDYKYRFVFPWNVDEKESKKVTNDRVATAVAGTVPLHERMLQSQRLDILDKLLAQSNGKQPETSASAQSTIKAHALTFSTSEAVNVAIRRELNSTIVPSEAAEIQSLLRQFVAGFPWAKLTDRLPMDVISHFQRFIRSTEMVDVCLSVCRLMYAAFVSQYCESVPALTQEQLEDIFLHITLAMSTVVRTPDGIEHAIRLLAIRVVVLAELTTHLPMFSTCDIGEGVKNSIDRIIMGIGDPAKLVCRICVFESTPQALRMLRHKRLPRMKIQDAKSPLAKLLLNDGTESEDFSDEIRELGRFVSLRNRQKLLNILNAGF